MTLAADLPGGAGLRPRLGAQLSLPWPAVIYLICVITPAWVDLGPLKLSVLRMFLLAVTVPLAVQLLSGRFGRILAIDWLMLGHALWIGVALWVNNPDRMVSQVGSVGLEFLGGYLVARAYVRSPEAFFALCRWVLLIVIAMLPIALIEARTGFSPVLRAIGALPGIDSTPIVHQPKRLGLDRVQAVFAHPIHFGLFCSISVALTFVALRDVLSGPVRWGGAVLAGGTGFLALSSGALLAVALQVALIGWATLFNRLRWRWWLLLGLFALAWVAIDLLSNRSPMRVFMSYATFSAHNAYFRGIIFEWGLKNVWGSPIFGIGLNDWVRPDFMGHGTVDNFWLLMAMRYGIPGFLCVAGAYLLGVGRIMARRFDGDVRLANIRQAWVFAMLGLGFTLATVHVWATVYSFVFFLFGAGIWLIAARPEGEGTAQAQTQRQAQARAPTPRTRSFAPADVRAPVRFRRFDPVTPAHRRPDP